MLFACVHDTHDRTHQSSIVEGKVQATVLVDCFLDHGLHISRSRDIDV